MLLPLKNHLTLIRDRTTPVGYKVSMIPFGADGQPIANSDSNTAAIDILMNADNSACPQNCFRPAGIAFDSQGRLFVSSDATGEIYVVIKDQVGSANGSPTSRFPSATISSRSGANKLCEISITALLSASVTLMLNLVTF